MAVLYNDKSKRSLQTVCGMKRRAAYPNAGMEKQLEVFNVLLNGCCQEQFNKAWVMQTVLNVGSTREKFIISFSWDVL